MPKRHVTPQQITFAPMDIPVLLLFAEAEGAASHAG